MIGAMTMPEDFKYKDVLLAGKPVHTWNDPFRLKHPSMPNARRAKIFSPFDALEGFSDAVASKEVLYEFRRELSDEQREQLGRKLSVLGSLTANSRMARANRVRVTVTYFVPCSDTDMDSYGYRGRYVQCAGLLRKVSQQAVRVEDTVIPLADIAAIECAPGPDGRGVFREDAALDDWEDQSKAWDFEPEYTEGDCWDDDGSVGCRFTE